jgi:ATP-dependent RNA helicase DDX35
MAGFWRPGADAPSTSAPSTLLTLDVDADADATGTLIQFEKNPKASLSARRRALPIAAHADELMYCVEKHQTTVVVGHTGCGKTTQIPQYLRDGGWCGGGATVAVTQPRRVAAQTVAQRVAEEVGCVIGDTVGYAIRFEDVCTPGKTEIKFCTDGALLRELAEDPLLTKYSVVIVDEAHERTLATDVLLGLLKKVQRARRDLRLIVSSATIQAESFAAFFDASGEDDDGDGPSRKPIIMSVEGRAHGVLIHYLDEPTGDYVLSAVETALEVHRNEGPGDILIFLTGEGEIDDAVNLLEEEAREMKRDPRRSHDALDLVVCPLYAGLNPAAQLEAFRPPRRGARKVVVATNVAETSVTIEGVVYVIDSCFAKQKAFDPERGMESLFVAPASKASTNQRAGRAGRVRPGKCFRLCTEIDYRSLADVTAPEIVRSDLASTVLQIKAMGIDNIMNFEWVSPPPAANMIKALELLYALQAVDDDARLTKPLGMHLAELPLEPQLGKALLVSGELGCVQEMLTVSAYLQVQTLWVSPRGRQKRLDECRDRFAVAEGDAVTALNVHTAWCKAGGAQGGGRARSFADKNMLSHRALVRASDIRAQLARHVRRVGLVVSSAGKDSAPLRRAMTAGFFANAATLAPHGGGAEGSAFRSVRGGATLFIHPGSVLFRARPAMVVYAAAVRTGKEYMRDVTAIDPEWLSELAPHFYAPTQRSGNERPADAAAVF